jgi:hypothetical protein
MDIFLDTRDLINIIEKSKPLTLSQLNQILKSGNHKIVYDAIVICEIAAPILHTGKTGPTIPVLNALERLPHKFINIPKIFKEELTEAIVAFNTGGEPGIINPFVERLDEAFSPDGLAPTRLLLNFGITETVLELLKHGSEFLKWRDDQVDRFVTVIDSDRKMSKPPSTLKGFAQMLQRQLEYRQVESSGVDTQELASWVYESKTRCSTVRLQFELYHQLRRNFTDPLSASDLGDFAHIQCLPYVDLMTQDRRMVGYIRRATQQWMPVFGQRVDSDVQALLKRLEQ